MEVDKTKDIEKTEEMIEKLRPKPRPIIPVRVIEVKDLNNAPAKTVKGTRSNHYIYLHNILQTNIVLFTNQRIYKLVIENCSNSIICLHDSVAIETRTIELLQVKNCSIIFDEIDVRTINCFGCENVSFQFVSDPTLLDEARFFWANDCRKIRIERVQVKPGTDPNRDPVLPVILKKYWTIDFQEKQNEDEEIAEKNEKEEPKEEVKENEKEEPKEEVKENEKKETKEEVTSEDNMKPEKETVISLPPNKIGKLIVKSSFTVQAIELNTELLSEEAQISRTPTDVLNEIQAFQKNSAILDGMGTEKLGDLYEEEVREYLDPPEEFDLKVKKVAEAIKNAKHCFLFSGAGISTAAKLPDYRGPRGAWTVQANKRSQPLYADKKLSQALPTYAHYAIAELVRRDIIKYIVSTNMDGLHRRSGIPPEKITEIHGNCYREVCTKCSKEYLRAFDTLDTRTDRWSHLTGRLCSCGGPLRDTIVHFTENWSLPEEVNRGREQCYMADVSLALGSSMLVQPSVAYPTKTLKNNGKLVIVTLQHTPYDEDCFVKIYAKTDDFMKALMKELEIETFDTTYDHLEHLPPDDSKPSKEEESTPKSKTAKEKSCIIQ